VTLAIGGEYLLGLDGDGSDELSGGFSAKLCGLTWTWSDDVKADIEDCYEDPCDGACTDSQVLSFSLC